MKYDVNDTKRDFFLSKSELALEKMLSAGQCA